MNQYITNQYRILFVIFFVLCSNFVLISEYKNEMGLVMDPAYVEAVSRRGPAYIDCTRLRMFENSQNVNLLVTNGLKHSNQFAKFGSIPSGSITVSCRDVPISQLTIPGGEDRLLLLHVLPSAQFFIIITSSDSEFRVNIMVDQRLSVVPVRAYVNPEVKKKAMPVAAAAAPFISPNAISTAQGQSTPSKDKKNQRDESLKKKGKHTGEVSPDLQIDLVCDHGVKAMSNLHTLQSLIALLSLTDCDRVEEMIHNRRQHLGSSVSHADAPTWPSTPSPRFGGILPLQQSMTPPNKHVTGFYDNLSSPTPIDLSRDVRRKFPAENSLRGLLHLDDSPPFSVMDTQRTLFRKYETDPRIDARNGKTQYPDITSPRENPLQAAPNQGELTPHRMVQDSGRTRTVERVEVGLENEREKPLIFDDVPHFGYAAFMTILLYIPIEMDWSSHPYDICYNIMQLFFRKVEESNGYSKFAVKFMEGTMLVKPEWISVIINYVATGKGLSFEATSKLRNEWPPLIHKSLEVMRSEGKTGRKVTGINGEMLIERKPGRRTANFNEKDLPLEGRLELIRNDPIVVYRNGRNTYRNSIFPK